MLGLPMMLGAGMKNMLAKRKAKKVQGEVKEVAPQVIKALSGMPRLREPDRSPDEVPTKRLNYFNYGQPMKRYNDAARTGLYKLKDIPSGNEGKGLRKMAQSNAGAEKVKEFGYNPKTALARKMAFCGGSSKPYKKK